MAEPTPTTFELELDAVADPIFGAKRTGYAWGPVDELLHQELDIPGASRCKKANGSGRAANVLTESNDKAIDLYLVFIGPTYSRQAFLKVAKDRIKRFPNVRTVAIADRTSGMWRVRSIVERSGVGLADRIRHAFPAVSREDVHLIEGPPENEASSSEAIAVPAVDPDDFASMVLDRDTSLEALADLPRRLIEVAGKGGVILDLTTATDLLASMLSSQLLLFAGPSGTGKSTYAHVLQTFFADDEHSATIEARRQWLSPDDLFGYYSVLGDQFAATPETAKLIGLHEASVAPVLEDGDEFDCPVVVVEEINLSAPEGYLAPVVHGLSGVQTPYIRWALHSRAEGAVDESTGLTLPETAMLGPYPRFLGTINVDSTASAPARKVAARSCVVLLEPTELTAEDLGGLVAATVAAEPADGAGTAAEYLGDPLTALESLPTDDRETLARTLETYIAHLGGTVVSRRDALRCLAYMAYFMALSDGLANRETRLALAGENAVLHCVLPTLDVDHFVPALRALEQGDLADPPSGGDSLGGQLGDRITRLLDVADSSLGIVDSIDYWTALS